MEFEEQIKNTLFENTLNYLHCVSDQLPDSANILKSFYSSKYRILEVRGNVYLPFSRNKTYQRCPRCCLQLCEGPTEFTVTPELKKSKFAKKVLKKIERNKGLTRFQMKYAKKMPKNPQNYLKIVCSFCQKTTKHALTKPAKEVPDNDVIIVTNTKKKSKKKKKDKFSGLKVNAVVDAQNELNLVNTEGADYIKFNEEKKNKKEVKSKKKKVRQLNSILNNKSGKDTSMLHNFLQSFQ